MSFFKTLGWALLLLRPCVANVFDDNLSLAAPKKSIRNIHLKHHLSKRHNTSICDSPSCYRYYNSKTQPYFIESWPDVDWVTGEFYSGLVPIDEADPTRALFFIFKPAEDGPVDEVTIWLNGGPGCSSVAGFFQENGPIVWQPGTERLMPNEWAWSNLTNMRWVEQPVNVGYSTGKVETTNEVDLAKEFLGFYRNWQKLFDIEDYDTYLTGESYAGRYIPYIGAQMLDLQDTMYFNLKGALLYDPCIGDCYAVQGIYPLYYFALNNNEFLNVPEEVLTEAEQIADACGYNEFLDTYLQYPPPGNQPTVNENVKPSCDVRVPLQPSILNVNPCYFCPTPYDNLHTYSPYFDRQDVKIALHAPRNKTWMQCTNHPVFVGGDSSPDVNIDGGVLPQIIEATNNVLISNGDWDALLQTNGTLLAIQNMTWNGALGFQSPPDEDLVIPLSDPELGAGPQGIMGKTHKERGLQWVSVDQAGHYVPQYQPRVAYRQLQWLLGRVDSL